MEEIREKIRAAVRKLYGVDLEVEVTVAPEGISADFSSNVALKLAKELKRNPLEIAEEIAIALKKEGYDGEIAILRPGFMNFISSDEYFLREIGDLAENFDKNISRDEYSGKMVICEFSDPNPFKVLHVGHLYTSVVGDAISRLFEYAGAKVVRANFGGDVGLHVAKTLYALMQRPVADAGFSDEKTERGDTALSDDDQRGVAGCDFVKNDGEALEKLTIEEIARCYVLGTAAYEEDAEAKAEITRLNKEIYRINAEDIHGTELADLYWRGRELSYEYFKEFYARIGLKFDKYYPESTVAGLGLKTVLEELEAGVYEKSDGAVVFDGEKFGLHTRVFINREGVPTYEAKDVGLIFTKYNDYHFDKSVVITGNEQTDYMKVVLKSVEQYAPELVERTSHLTHGLVKLEGNVKMSSRKGNFLKAVEVLDLISQELEAEYHSADEKVMLAATKYAFLKYKMGGDIVFDPKASVKMTGNSGPYLLYSAVRAKKILGRVAVKGQAAVRGETKAAEKKAGTTRAETAAEGEIIMARGKVAGKYDKFERGLAKKILMYKGVLAEAVSEMAPHKVAGYLYEVAQEFSRFYEHCPVAGDKREIERAELVRAYLLVMMHGLGILGIEIPEEM